MIAPLKRLLIVALVAGSYTLGGATFSNQRVTTQVPPAGNCTSLPPAVTTFVTTEGNVYLFFDAAVTTNDSLKNDWLAPDGTVVAGSGWSPVSGNYCFDNAPSLAISNLPASHLGTWQARVWDNGNLLFSVAFTVSGFSHQVVTTQAPPATGCVRPAAATSFLTTDDTVFLYFEATITTSDSLTDNWLAPDGTVIAGVGWNIASGYFCMGDSLSISNLPASQLGSWQVRVYDNGVLFFSVPFTVGGPAVAAPVISTDGIVNGASFQGPVSAGSIVSIFGTALASDIAQATTASLPFTLGTTRVLMNGMAAPLFYVSPSQINAQVPWEVTGVSTTNLAVQVTANDSTSNVANAVMANAAPGIFVVVHNADGSAITAAKPAVPGEYLLIYCTGLGPVTNQPPAGMEASSSPLSSTIQAATVTIEGIPAYAPFSGLAPGFVGLYQVNVQVPANVASSSSAPLVLLSYYTSATVNIAVQSGGVQQFTLTTATAGSGSGSVSANPPGPSYPAGTVVTLTATPNAGSIFAGWSGACSGTAGCTVTMNSNQSVTATFNLAATTGPSITSLSSTSLAPLNLLIITGSAFDPTAQLQVTFFNNAGFSVALPAILATSTEVLSSVPPYSDQAGNLGGGTVSISVTQSSSSGISITSNVLGGFQIQALPVAPPLPAGSLTLALLTATLQATTNLQTTISGTPLGTPDMQTALSGQAAILQNLIPKVQSVMNGASASFTIGQINGSNANVSLQDLVATDRLLVELLTAFAGPVPDLGSLGVPSADAVLRILRGHGVPLTEVTTGNPVQAAALAALDALMDPATTALQANQALATFIGSFVQTNPAQAGAYLLMGAGVLAAAAFPPAEIGVAAGALITGAIGALSVPLATGDIIAIGGVGAAGAIATACAEGYTLATAFQDVVKGIIEESLPKLVGQVYEIFDGLNNVITITLNGGCGPYLKVTPPKLTFSATQGGPNPHDQLLDIGSVSGAPIYSGAEATSDSGWLSLTGFVTGTTTWTTSVSANPSGLALLAGNYSGAIEVSPIPGGGAVKVPVSLVVSPPNSYTLTVAYAGTGTGTAVPSSSPAGTPCDTNCWTYPAGTNTAVTLTETAKTGSTFAGWSGACSGTGTTCRVTMSTNQTVTATFNLAASQSVTPATAFLGSLNTCAATTQQISQVFQVTAPAGIAWSAEIYGNPSEFGYGITNISPSSGSGSGAFTVIVEALPIGTTNCLPSSTPMSGSVVVYFPPTGNPAVDEVFVTVTWNDVT